MERIIVVNPKIRRVIGNYEFIEAELKWEGEKDIAQFDELVAAYRQARIKEIYECEHMFRKPESGVSKFGKEWSRETCLDCFAERWMGKDGKSWDSWKHKMKGGY